MRKLSTIHQEYPIKLFQRVLSFFMKKKVILYGILNLKKKELLYQRKVEEFTNEKLIIIYMIFENKIIQNNLEQVSNLKFKNSNLNN